MQLSAVHRTDEPAESGRDGQGAMAAAASCGYDDSGAAWSRLAAAAPRSASVSKIPRLTGISKNLGETEVREPSRVIGVFSLAFPVDSGVILVDREAGHSEIQRFVLIRNIRVLEKKPLSVCLSLSSCIAFV